MKTDDVAPVAVTDRSGFPESLHHGIVVALDRHGDVRTNVGNPDAVLYPRSSNKPMQSDAMVTAGWRPTFEQLALACASHSGTHRHVAVVHSTLREAGLEESALHNTPGLPIDEESAHEVIESGASASPILMNCSGKHAAMCATALANGWPVDGYLAANHPVQAAITQHIESMVGPVVHVGIDGCGAPAHAMSLVALARAYRHLAMERTMVWSAMTTHPDLVGGPGRDVTTIMRLVPDLMAKDGAEGVFAAALPDGRAAAVKIADGNHRAAGTVLAAALTTTGVDVDPAELGPPILGHGQPVGRIRPLLGA